MVEYSVRLAGKSAANMLRKSSAFAVKQLDSQDDLCAAAAEWRALFAQAARTSVFQSWEWCVAWWRAFSADYARLAVIQVYDAADLIMILPFCMQTTPNGDRMLQPLAHTVSDYVDCLVKPGYEPLLGAALIAVMKRLGARAIKTGYTASWSCLRQAISALQSNARVEIVQPWPPERCPAIVLPDSWESYYASRSTNLRKNIRHVRNQFQASGLVATCHHQPDRSLIAEAIGLHQRWMTHRQLVTVFRDERSADFLEQVTTQLARQDQVRLFTIHDKSRLVAFDLVLKDKAWYYAYISGIDQVYLDTSPGVVNLIEIVRAAIVERLHGVDLMLGDEAYKFKWANAEASTVTVDLALIGAFASALRHARHTLRLRSRIKATATALRRNVQPHTSNSSEPT